MNSSGQRTLASGETLASGPNSLKASDKQMLFDWKAGQFSRMSCEGGKTFAVRPADDGRSVRVRAQHGSAELERNAAGHFVGDGYEFKLDATQGASLTHNGKPEAQNCKVSA